MIGNTYLDIAENDLQYLKLLRLSEMNGIFLTNCLLVAMIVNSLKT